MIACPSCGCVFPGPEATEIENEQATERLRLLCALKAQESIIRCLTTILQEHGIDFEMPEDKG